MPIHPTHYFFSSATMPDLRATTTPKRCWIPYRSLSGLGARLFYCQMGQGKMGWSGGKHIHINARFTVILSTHCTGSWDCAGYWRSSQQSLCAHMASGREKESSFRSLIVYEDDDLWMMGGDFIVKNDGKVLFALHQTTYNERPPIDDLLSCLKDQPVIEWTSVTSKSVQGGNYLWSLQHKS